MSDSVPHYGLNEARQAPLSMDSSRQGHWSGLSCLPPGDLPDPGVEPRFLMSSELAGKFFPTSATWEARINSVSIYKYTHLYVHIEREKLHTICCIPPRVESWATFTY